MSIVDQGRSDQTKRYEIAEMNYRKVSSTPWPTSDTVAITVEPRLGISEDDVVKLLNSKGAHRVTVVAPGFISAEARTESLDEIERIAHVHVKPEHQLHAD